MAICQDGKPCMVVRERMQSDPPKPPRSVPFGSWGHLSFGRMRGPCSLSQSSKILRNKTTLSLCPTPKETEPWEADASSITPRRMCSRLSAANGGKTTTIALAERISKCLRRWTCPHDRKRQPNPSKQGRGRETGRDSLPSRQGSETQRTRCRRPGERGSRWPAQRNVLGDFVGNPRTERRAEGQAPFALGQRLPRATESQKARPANPVRLCLVANTQGRVCANPTRGGQREEPTPGFSSRGFYGLSVADHVVWPQADER